MACIIVRIAAKLATCVLRRLMSIDPIRTELTLHDDPRLIAGVAAIVSFAAHRCGLSSGAQAGLAAAAAEACRETFPLVNNNGSKDAALKVIVSDFPDRVEVAIEHSGESLPSAGLDTFCDAASGAGSQAGLSGALQKTNVDRVQYETRDGVSRTTLIKYCDERRAKV
jgi:anti-sigma regulatory factor (Ser/Thr protein kinase)